MELNKNIADDVSSINFHRNNNASKSILRY